MTVRPGQLITSIGSTVVTFNLVNGTHNSDTDTLGIWRKDWRHIRRQATASLMVRCSATTVPRAIAIWRATMQCQSCRSVSSAVKDSQRLRPTTDEQFELPASYGYLSAYVATDGYMDWWQVFPSNYDVQSENDPPAWFLYIVEGDKLWEVDLRQRLPRVIFEKQGLNISQHAERIAIDGTKSFDTECGQ